MDPTPRRKPPVYHFFTDGGTPLAVAYGAMLLSVLTVILVYFLRPQPHSGLCEYPSPRQILTHVAGIDDPAVKANGQVVERATRCVSGGKALDVLAYRNFRNVDTNDVIVDLRGDPAQRAAGRNTTDTVIQLPPKVTPGTWRLEGADSVPTTGEFRSWFSEPFEVVN
jgi:hypothetical protein